MAEKKKTKTRVNIPLLIIAIALFALAGGMTVHNLTQVTSANKALDEMIAGLEEAQMAELNQKDEIVSDDEIAEEPVEEEEEEEYWNPHELDESLGGMPTFSWKEWTYIGWISIPKLELHLPVMSTYSTSLLAISPCRFQGSTTRGNLVIMGHNYSHHFGNLSKLQPGDEVSLNDGAKNDWYYHVTEIITLAPNDTHTLIEDIENWDLTIFTCDVYGFKRIVVRCVLDEAPAEIAES